MLLRQFAPLPSWNAASRDLGGIRHEMERLFDTLSGSESTRRSGVFPAMNVTENDESLLIRAELPGMDKNSLKVTFENGTLTVAGERKNESAGEEAGFHRREREWGTFRRSFSIPTRIDGERIEARYAHGVLTVQLPKAAEVRPRQITVQVAS